MADGVTIAGLTRGRTGIHAISSLLAPIRAYANLAERHHSLSGGVVWIAANLPFYRTRLQALWIQSCGRRR